jgi:hypothetical protein
MRNEVIGSNEGEGESYNLILGIKIFGKGSVVATVVAIFIMG